MSSAPRPESQIPLGRLALFGGEGGADVLLRSRDGLLDRRRKGDGGVAAVQLAGDGVGDGGFGGQHRRQGVGLFAGARHAHQGDHFRILEGPAHQKIERPGILAEQVRSQFDEQMAAGEHLPSGQFPVRCEDLAEHPPDALQCQVASDSLPVL